MFQSPISFPTATLHLAIYFAIVKERSPSGFVHDGFMPFNWDTADCCQLSKKIEEIHPQLHPNTKMLVIGKSRKSSSSSSCGIFFIIVICVLTFLDKHGDEVVAWPHKGEQFKDFIFWLKSNYSNGERVKIYIETNAQEPQKNQVIT